MNEMAKMLSPGIMWLMCGGGEGEDAGCASTSCLSSSQTAVRSPTQSWDQCSACVRRGPDCTWMFLQALVINLKVEVVFKSSEEGNQCSQHPAAKRCVLPGGCSIARTAHLVFAGCWLGWQY